MAAKGGVNHHPFSDSIMRSALPEGFKLPMMEKYDGLSDAEEHLAVFNAHMLFYGDIATDALKCRAFPTTLTKFAIRWFFALPPKSINSFSELSAKFIERHALTIDVPKSYRAIQEFQQGAHESLREYINRFNQEAMQVDPVLGSAFSELAIHAFRQGLNPGPFADSLVTLPAKNLVELRRHASCFTEEEQEEKEPENMATWSTRPYRGRKRKTHW